MTTTDKIEPIHPGEVLMEDFIEGFGITQNKLAVSIGMPSRRRSSGSTRRVTTSWIGQKTEPARDRRDHAAGCRVSLELTAVSR